MLVFISPLPSLAIPTHSSWLVSPLFSLTGNVGMPWAYHIPITSFHFSPDLHPAIPALSVGLNRHLKLNMALISAPDLLPTLCVPSQQMAPQFTYPAALSKLGIIFDIPLLKKKKHFQTSML